MTKKINAIQKEIVYQMDKKRMEAIYRFSQGIPDPVKKCGEIYLRKKPDILNKLKY